MMIKNSTRLSCLFMVLLTACQLQNNNPGQNIKELEKYNIEWDSPGPDHNASMPSGNGDIGLNVWVEENGDICFFISKTDSWDDNGRLLKIGKVRVKCEPALIFPGSEFRQRLDLYSGTIHISSKGRLENRKVSISLKLWVDANNPFICLSHQSTIPVKLTATAEPWRNEPDTLPELNTSDLLEDRSKPGNLHEPVVVEPDVIIQGPGNYIGWYHHNRKSAGFDLVNSLQGLSEFFDSDPILHRTFGAIVSGTDVKKTDDKNLYIVPSKTGSLYICVLTKHPSDPETWLSEAEKLTGAFESVPLAARRRSHEKWWAEFWERSWIHATSGKASGSPDNNDAFIVSRAYALQRYINASAGRGSYPIKFNGSIFTVPSGQMPGYADYRRWGPGYWWQNTRLPYLSMCAAGDYDLIQPLFSLYAGDIYKLCRSRTGKYFGFEGAYFPECMYFWGSVFTSTYGWTPYEERTDKLQESGWHKWEWVAGPELVSMMLDYYDYTLDSDFLEKKIIPLVNDVIRFFDNYYQTGEDGKLTMYPSMACETWWDCTNPMPELAGLKSITFRLLGLPDGSAGRDDRESWQRFSAKLPEIPVRETPSGPALAPAERYEKKNNIENPELYAVFPFRLFGIGRPDTMLALNALKHRWDSGNSGWRQDDIFMAYLGLTDQARDNLVNRAGNFDKNSRFPAFWGPNYDWTPDQDHGGVLMKAFQSMLIQADPYSRKIYLLPAWPEDWNVSFKIHAPYKTILEGRVSDGKIKSLKITPPSREKDLIILN